MGNSIFSDDNPLPNNWQRINSNYLKNIYTQQIIHEHLLTLRSQQQLIVTTNYLRKRITLHHSNIPKVIYYRNLHDLSLCSSLLSRFEIILYTQFVGATLGEINLNRESIDVTCPCLKILSSVQYLIENYGFFQLTEQMVFFGNRRERNVKVWINSKVHLCQRQIQSTQIQMCRSLIRLFKILISSKACSQLNLYELQKINTWDNLKDFKRNMLQMHSISKRHKKSHSIYLQSSKDINEAIRQNKNNQNRTIKAKSYVVKANSMPQKSSENWIFPKHQGQNIQPRQIISFENHIVSSGNNRLPKAHQIINGIREQNMKICKVNFTYNKRQQRHRVDDYKSYPQNLLKGPIDIDIKRQSNDANFQQSKAFTINLDSLVSQHVSYESSKNNSPLKNNLHKGTLTDRIVREIQLPIKEKTDNGSSKLPTTSRSPNLLHDNNSKIEPIEQIPEISIQKQYLWHCISNKMKNKNIQNTKTKFQIYQDQIRKYGEKLMGKNIKRPQTNRPFTHKYQSQTRKTTSPIKEEFKLTKSIYNDSSDQQGIKSKQMINNLNIPSQLTVADNQFTSFEREVGSIQYHLQKQQHFEQKEKDYKKSEFSNRRAEINNIREPLFTLNKLSIKEVAEKQSKPSILGNDRAFLERLENIQMEKQLIREKELIKKELQSIIKDDDRSIRQRVKKKKENFAQLRAQATKILEDDP